MISELKKQDISFLKYVRDNVLQKYNLPATCVSLEFMNDDYFKLIFPMKEFPIEVFLYRYEIIDQLHEDIKGLTDFFSTKKIHFMKVHVDYRPKSKNLLLIV